ncbi:EVE domain-containing protein [Psychrobacter okhotskensis]|uniref:EVE domain-containing protein n=1 Tax=Psychrobacter okhotskensis TaxID=212403 RepID=UPI001FCFDD22|nr:EVE domain-containing protein [Psychrobacter okhotskensis]
MAYWLMKSNPKFFSIHDLQRLGTEGWDGVRNYRARNFMRDDMQVGDKVRCSFITLAPSLLALLVS